MRKRALLSVSDKTGIVNFAKRLSAAGYDIISTGGTKKALEEQGMTVTSVEDVTGFPECFGGRVKTMHPMIMGGVLMRRGEDDADAARLGVQPIDLVVVNLYPFEEAVSGQRSAVSKEELIELIDIGGPTLLRSAAKNAAYVTVITDIGDYEEAITQIETSGDTTKKFRAQLASKVFARTAAYDAAIATALSEGENTGLMLSGKTETRYGENPHQHGAYYDIVGMPRAWTVVQEGDKKISYLNLLDADGAWNLVREFSEPTAACIKHANPSGVASDTDIANAFQKSYDTDKLSAFGVIVALNRPCTSEVVEKLIEQKIFAEVLIAPSFEPDAMELLKKKPKLRVIAVNGQRSALSQYRSCLGGMLVQNFDDSSLEKSDLKIVTDAKPTDAQINDLLFAWNVVKHTKSNAIVFAKDLVTVGIGAGQTSRVDSVWIAAKRAGERAQGSVMASDAFFPFPDAVEEAAKHGVVAIIQPGGSVRDEEVFAKANELGIPMVLTGVRVFRH